MYRFGLNLLMVTFLAFAGGCGSKITVDGFVRFEDGTPLTTGTVYFESATTTSRGQLDTSGRYVLESSGAKDGVPPGNYKVYILGATDSEYGTDGQWTYKPLIDEKFQSAATSGLTCDVTKKMPFDITVTPPK